MNSTSVVDPLDILLSAALAPLFLLLYIGILTIIVVEWKHFRNPYYSMALGLGLCHVAMLTRFVYTFIIAHQGGYVFGAGFDSFMATLAWSVGWHSVLTYQMVIGVNRFVAIIFFNKYQRIFKPRLTATLVFLSYVSGALTVGPLLLEHRMNYDFALRMNVFVPEDPSTEWFYFFDLVFACLAASTVLLMYATAILVSKYKLKQLTTSRPKFVKEMKMMMQGFVVSLTLLCQEMNFYLKLNSHVTLTFMLLHSGTTPLIYLTMDQKLRKYFAAYCRCDCRANRFMSETVIVNIKRRNAIVVPKHSPV